MNTNSRQHPGSQPSIRGRFLARFVPLAAILLAIGVVCREVLDIHGFAAQSAWAGGLLLAFVLAASLALSGALRAPLAELGETLRSAPRRPARGEDPGDGPAAWHGALELAPLAAEQGARLGELDVEMEQYREAERDSRRKSELLEATLENLGQGVCVFDRDLRLVSCNWRYLQIFDLNRSEVRLGMSFEEILQRNTEHGEYGFVSSEALIADRLAIARSGQPHGRERERPDGTILDIQSYPMPDGGFVSTYTDITQRREHEIQMRHLTLHDVLTHLPNRALFHDRLRQSLKAANVHQRVAVLLIDIDRFKEINETRGHAAGDQLLRGAAGRLMEVVAEGDTVATLGADEFGIVQIGLEHVDEAALLAERVLQLMGQPFEIEERDLRISVSIGITVFPDDGEHHDQLLRNVDLALHAAKAKGRGRYRYFVPAMNREVQQRKKLEEDLARALERGGELSLHYQPRAELATGEVVGVEALLRWNHPERGMVSPIEVIPVAEEYGLIVPLTEWVLKEACRQAVAWQAQGLDSLRVAVNVSAHCFREAGIVRMVERVLGKTGLTAEGLELEITESAFMENASIASEALAKLRDLGVGVALDDFGTGYSSLSYLHRFPIDALKIDRSFIRDLPDNPDASSIVRTILGLGRGLHLRVVAEGVETSAQLAYLRATECDEIQGFHLSAARPAEELAAWIGERTVGAGLAG